MPKQELAPGDNSEPVFKNNLCSWRAMCGCCARHEIDLLPLEVAFRWDDGVLRIEGDGFLSAERNQKKNSIADNSPLEPGLLVTFSEAYHAPGQKAAFVIESECDPKPGTAYRHYSLWPACF